MDIMGYQFQGTLVEFMIGGAIVGGGIQFMLSISKGEFPLGEVIMPAIAGSIIAVMVFFFYSGTR